MAVVSNKPFKKVKNNYKFNPMQFEGRSRPKVFTTREILCCARCKIPLRQVYGLKRYAQECPVCGLGSGGLSLTRVHLLPVFGPEKV